MLGNLSSCMFLMAFILQPFGYAMNRVEYKLIQKKIRNPKKKRFVILLVWVIKKPKH